MQQLPSLEVVKPFKHLLMKMRLKLNYSLGQLQGSQMGRTIQKLREMEPLKRPMSAQNTTSAAWQPLETRKKKGYCALTNLRNTHFDSPSFGLHGRGELCALPVQRQTQPPALL